MCSDAEGDVGCVQEATGKECGLHSGNVVESAAEQAQREAERDLWDTDAHVEALSREQLAALAGGPRDKATLVVLYAPWCPYSQVRPPSAVHLTSPEVARGLKLLMG